MPFQTKNRDKAYVKKENWWFGIKVGFFFFFFNKVGARGKHMTPKW